MERRKILVVDDSALVAEAVKAKLEASNYDVAVAHSGEEALEKVRETAPDLMILDVYMPGIDGFEVCRRLREDPADASIADRDAKLAGKYQRKACRVPRRSRRLPGEGVRSARSALPGAAGLSAAWHGNRPQLISALPGGRAARLGPVRVVIVDNSGLARLALTGILESDPDICVVGVARDGVEALEVVPRLKPDLVTVDVWMFAPGWVRHGRAIDGPAPHTDPRDYLHPWRVRMWILAWPCYGRARWT